MRLGYAGIIYNHNFAAEYHAPLIPLGLGLFFYLRSWWGRAILPLFNTGHFPSRSFPFHGSWGMGRSYCRCVWSGLIVSGIF